MTGIEISAYVGGTAIAAALGWALSVLMRPQPAPAPVRIRSDAGRRRRG